MMKVMKMLGFFYLLCSLTVAGQEEDIEIIHLHEPNPPRSSSIAVSVSMKELPLVSSSVVAAESWLKSKVLAYYPYINISTIVVGNDTLCNKKLENQWSLVLPSIKNLYFCLIRWGLVKEIRVSAAISSSCFEIGEAQKELKPLMSFLHESSLPYTIHQESWERLELSRIRDIKMGDHREYLKRMRFFRLRDVRTVRGSKPMKRKLSSLDFPSFSSRRSRPSPFQFAPVPGSSFSFDAPNAPAESPLPFVVPASPPHVPVESPLPFCIPPDSVPAPGAGEGEKVGLWCVAKPTVPEEKLQEAMDFACGEGGADCEEIRPNGNCFNPDNSVAHASYAFNSYWQKTKQSGGSCNFDGTAILINSDPSFLHCRFELS